MQAQFTDEQKAVVCAEPEGNVLVLASAGSGKTRVLVHRVAHLIETGHDPQDFCVLTFTNAAANELQARIASLLHVEVLVGTFHSVAARILDEEQDPFAHVDEVLTHFLHLLRSDSKKARFPFVFIDEAQDLNAAQALLVVELAKSAKHLILAGDDDQSIYAFRGADVSLLFTLASDLKCEVKNLTLNHRATPALVALANDVASKNVKARGELVKPPATSNVKRGEMQPFNPWVVECHSEAQELDFVFETISRGLKDGLVKPVEIAVLSRRAKPLHAMHARFRRGFVHVPTTLAASRPSEQKDVKEGAKNEENAVVLTTIHGSKGLEFKWVFVLNVNSFSIPDARTADTEEERRLFYVAVTRASSRLYLLSNPKFPSLFLAEMNDELYYRVDASSGKLLPNLTTLIHAQHEFADKKRKARDAGLLKFHDAKHLISRMDGAGFLRAKAELFVHSWGEVRAQLALQSVKTPCWPVWVDAHSLRNDALKFWHIVFLKVLAGANACRPREILKLLDVEGGWKRAQHVPANFQSEAQRAADQLADPAHTWKNCLREIWTLVTLCAAAQGRCVLWSVDVKTSELMELTAHCSALVEMIENTAILKSCNDASRFAAVKLRDVAERFESVADFELPPHALANVTPLSAYGQQDGLISHLAHAHFQAAQCVCSNLPYSTIVLVDLLACTVLFLDFSNWNKEQARAYLSSFTHLAH